nr:integrase, catalytic region, zinc finger, CCHC-type, peptidase aspartic, catalytic [Tanacetum cinerariifolium]
MRSLKKEIKSANYAKINHQSWVFVPQTTKSKEELFLSNVSNMVTVSKMISIPNEDLSDDTTPSVVRKFLNEVKSFLMTLQRVVKQKMTLEIHNWSSSAHKEEADESLDKQKSLELEIERLLKASVSHDIMSIMQNGFVDVPSDLRTKRYYTKEKLELCIIKRKKNTLFFDMQQKAHAKLHDLIYENAKLRSGLFENTFESVKNTLGTSVTPHVDKPKLIVVTPHSKKLHASSQSHSVPQPRKFNVVKHRNVISPGRFKINPSQMPRVDLVPNKHSSPSIRTNSITNSRHVTFKENVSSNTVTASSTGLEHTARTRRPQPKGNTRTARIPSASKSSDVKKNVTVEDHCRTLLLSKNQKTMSSEFVQICLWCVDSGCSKHMTENNKLLMKFVWKFLGTVRFGNDHIAANLGYGDLKWGNITNTRVYFVEEKDCAQTSKNQSKTGQYQHKNRSQQQKPDQQAIFSE